jgi:adenosylcobinamide-GDP ribazoletransferase
MIASLLGAAAFLTIFPVRSRTAPIGQSALFFPLIGAALGAMGAFLLRFIGAFLPADLATLLVLAFLACVTGGLHEDGFADVLDAFRAGRPRDRILTILKDSRIGAHGALALVLVSLIRWRSLTALSVDPLTALPAVLALSRSSMVILAWLTPPAGIGLGFAFSRTLNTAIAITVIIQALAWAWFSGAALLLVWGTSVILVCSRWYYVRRIGGVTGDCLGATCLLVETWGLILFACQRCM